MNSSGICCAEMLRVRTSRSVGQLSCTCTLLIASDSRAAATSAMRLVRGRARRGRWAPRGARPASGPRRPPVPPVCRAVVHRARTPATRTGNHAARAPTRRSRRGPRQRHAGGRRAGGAHRHPPWRGPRRPAAASCLAARRGQVRPPAPSSDPCAASRTTRRPPSRRHGTRVVSLVAHELLQPIASRRAAAGQALGDAERQRAEVRVARRHGYREQRDVADLGADVDLARVERAAPIEQARVQEPVERLAVVRLVVVSLVVVHVVRELAAGAEQAEHRPHLLHQRTQRVVGPVAAGVLRVVCELQRAWRDQRGQVRVVGNRRQIRRRLLGVAEVLVWPLRARHVLEKPATGLASATLVSSALRITACQPPPDSPVTAIRDVSACGRATAMSSVRRSDS